MLLLSIDSLFSLAHLVWFRTGKLGSKYLHVLLVGRVPAHHMQNRQSATGMLLEPSIEAKDRVVLDDDLAAVGDEGEDVATCEET